MEQKDKKLNFSLLFQKIELATKKAFLEMSKKEEIYGFALYSDENGESLWPIANTALYSKNKR